MSFSTRACFDSELVRSKRTSRKSIPQNFLGGAALACLVLGSAWTVYTNVFRADVYPTLDSANFDAPVVKRQASVAAREPQAVVNDAFAALREQAPPVAQAVALAPASTLSFGDRFAASAPQGVEPAPQPSVVAEAPSRQPPRRNSLKPRSRNPTQRNSPKRRRRPQRRFRSQPFRRNAPQRRRRRDRRRPPSATWRSAPRPP